jgi:phosphoglycerol transferase MdoB-like AlkP superfamily enzyme
MSIAHSFRNVSPIAALGRLAESRRVRAGVIAAIHVVALGILAATESGWLGPSLALLFWAFLNLVFLAALRRPGISAVLSLAVVAILVMLSQLKFTILWMVINFFDILIVDSDTVAFLLSIFPDLRTTLVIAAVLAIPVLVLIWRIDPFRVARPVSLLGAVACAIATTGLSLAVPEEPSDQFQGINHISTFVRSGFTTGYELATKGWIDADATTSDQLRAAKNEPCHLSGKPPNIIMVLDEASFDVSALPGIKVPPNYRDHFQSFDGKTRSLLVEGSGGPTWYTEYNVLTGLSARSYGRLSYYVTRIAAGRVERGLPQALRRCGYKTITLYPAYGAFLSARKFQETAGIGRFVDSNEMKAGDVEPDRFYYDKALKMIESEKGDQPLFIFVYTVFNHFPWWNRMRPELTPDWRDLGNDLEVDEYIRRQTLSARDYADFKQRLARDFPKDAFLMLRFGDHQPGMARIIDPAATDDMVAQRMSSFDPRYFTTYYALDAINFRPKDVSSALDRLEAPYLPLVIQEAAGLPLDPSFVEQKKILERCHGLFFQCAGGAEARRFNRLLIDAGLIKGMVSR